MNHEDHTPGIPLKEAGIPELLSDVLFVCVCDDVQRRGTS